MSIYIGRLKKYIAQTLGLNLFNKNPNISIAKSAHVRPKTSISCGPSGRVIIDEEVFINELCSIDTWESVIHIGHSVLIGPGSVLNTHHHCFESNDVPIKKQNGTGKPIIIVNGIIRRENTNFYRCLSLDSFQLIYNIKKRKSIMYCVVITANSCLIITKVGSNQNSQSQSDTTVK